MAVKLPHYTALEDAIGVYTTLAQATTAIPEYIKSAKKWLDDVTDRADVWALSLDWGSKAKEYYQNIKDTVSKGKQQCDEALVIFQTTVGVEAQVKPDKTILIPRDYLALADKLRQIAYSMDSVGIWMELYGEHGTVTAEVKMVIGSLKQASLELPYTLNTVLEKTTGVVAKATGTMFWEVLKHLALPITVIFLLYHVTKKATESPLRVEMK